MLNSIIPITLTNIEREHPNVVISPRRQHPIFYGCLDWHSAVHSHWQLVRAIRVAPDAPFAPAVLALLDKQLGNAAGLAQETAFMTAHPRYELPYGWAWLLQLCAELHEWGGNQTWRDNLRPLEALAAQRIKLYLPKLAYPLRSGMHRQTAFAMTLIWDWAQIVGDDAMLRLIDEHARHWFANDENAPFAYEPSGTDFLSPSLAEADLMRRLMSQDAFIAWFGRFAPDLTRLPKPVAVSDPSDGQLAHFAGLNLSRAWMLEGIAAQLPVGERQASLLNSAEKHRAAGLDYATSDEYMISHWVPSFAVYLLTANDVGLKFRQ